jgi:glycosyltransferase involved in cell wall biosynthesis
MSHKRIEVAVRAFSELGLPLVVAGDGPEARKLHRIAGPSVRFAGRVTDDEAARLLQACRALVVPAVEEFGIAAVEAQAAGRPVIAVDAGGVRETVQDGVNGCFFDGTVAGLTRAVRSFDDAAIDPAACVANARRFGVGAFRRDLLGHVAQVMDDTPAPHARERAAWPAARQRDHGARRAG